MTTGATALDFERIEVTDELPNCRKALTGIAELAADIGQRGMLQPLIVWHRKVRTETPYALPSGKTVWDRYVLIAGHRRYAALVHLRKDDPEAFGRVRVTLFEGNEDDARFAQLAENLSRVDLSPADLADALVGMKARGHTTKVIAMRLARSERWVTGILAFRANAAEAVVRAVSDGKLSFRLGQELAALDEAAQLESLARYLTTQEGGGTKAARAEVKAEIERPKRDAEEGPARPPVADVRKLFARLDNAPRKSARVRDARNVLAWVLGEGEWPEGLDVPE